MKGTLIVMGVFMLGFVLPEILAAFGKTVPLLLNFWVGSSCAIIAVACVI